MSNELDLKEGEIRLYKQPDGNWIGWMHKNGQLISVRQGDPSTVLQLLLTAG